jgi:hypothetical protein
MIILHANTDRLRTGINQLNITTVQNPKSEMLNRPTY